jgi:3-isopropylmalate dehydratase small subunit
MDAYEKLFIKMEAKRKLCDGEEVGTKTFDKIQVKRKLTGRMQVAKQLLVRMKVLKVANGNSAGKIIPVKGNKKGSLGGYILVVDAKFGSNGSKGDLLSAIKDAGINYVVAPDFAEGLYEIAARIKLHLIKFSGPNLIDEGDELEVHLRDGFILNVDTGLRNNIVPHVCH